MNNIRIMTYHISGCRGRDGRVDHGRVFDVIASGAADLVALQGVDPESEAVAEFAGKLGMTWYADRASTTNAYLSYYPLSGLRFFDLGHGGLCLRADLEFFGKRIHLFNLQLSSVMNPRKNQVATLLGSDLLGSHEISCPTLVMGDFADFWWGAGNFNLALLLRKVSRPFWHATYPSRFPLFGRDRVYLRGEIRALEASVLRQPSSRQASRHLPLVLTLQINDPRNYLHDKALRTRMNLPAGEPLCG